MVFLTDSISGGVDGSASPACASLICNQCSMLIKAFTARQINGQLAELLEALVKLVAKKRSLMCPLCRADKERRMDSDTLPKSSAHSTSSLSSRALTIWNNVDWIRCRSHFGTQGTLKQSCRAWLMIDSVINHRYWSWCYSHLEEFASAARKSQASAFVVKKLAA